MQAAWLADHPGGCVLCRNTGKLYGTELCTCERGKKLLDIVYAGRWEAAGIEARHARLSLDGFPEKGLVAYATVCDFARHWDGKRGLLLHGPVGAGKTGLAVGLMRAWLPQVERLRFVDSVDFLDDQRPGRGTDERQTKELRSIRGTDLLCLDDLGKSKPSDWVHERLFQVIDYRSKRCLPTLVTTNYSPKDLVERIGEASVSRLVEMCVTVEMDRKARDLRMPKR